MYGYSSALGIPDLTSGQTDVVIKDFNATGDGDIDGDLDVEELITGVNGITMDPQLSNPDTTETIWSDGTDLYYGADKLTGQTTAPSGLDTYVQFNDGGAFGSDSRFYYDKSTDTLTTYKSLITYSSPTGYALTTTGGGRIGDNTFTTDIIGGVSDVATHSTNGACCMGRRSYNGMFDWINANDGATVYDWKWLTGSAEDLVMTLTSLGVLQPAGGMEMPTLAANPGTDCLWYDGTELYIGSDRLTNQETESAGNAGFVQLSDGSGGFLASTTGAVNIDMGTGFNINDSSADVRLSLYDYDSDDYVLMVGDPANLPTWGTTSSNSGSMVMFESSAHRAGIRIFSEDDDPEHSSLMFGYRCYTTGSNVRTVDEGRAFAIEYTSDNDIDFKTIGAGVVANTALTSRMKITEDGDVEIVNDLDIGGILTIDANDKGPSDSDQWQLLAWNGDATGSGVANEVATITDLDSTTSGSNLRISTLGTGEIFRDTSSKRLKTDIKHDLSHLGSAVLNLEPATFVYKKNPDGERGKGFIAEEAYACAPEFTFEQFYKNESIGEDWDEEGIWLRDTEDGSFWVGGIDDRAILAGLLEAIKIKDLEYQTLQSSFETLQADFLTLKDYVELNLPQN